MKNKKIVIPPKNERFTHALGHDIKQPLGLIRAYSYYIKKNLKDAPPTLLQYPEKIDQQVDHITSMLNNIVESTKLSERRILFKKDLVNVTQVLKNIFIELQTKYPAAIFKLNSSSKHSLIEGDKLYISLALTHILENGIWYTTTKSPISIKVTTDNSTVAITITDTGIGIPPQEVENIFEEYYRASNAKQVAVKGLGLGLFIAKEIVIAHQGTLTAQSSINSGTAFTITLPLLKE